MLSMLLSLITRGKVSSAKVGPRTVMQVTGLDNETFNGVELLLPPGYTARPAQGADVMILQCNGTRDHKVALAGDTVGQVQADLQPGEFGLVGFGSIIIFRQGQLQVKSTVPVNVSSTQPVSVTSTQQITLSAPVITTTAAGSGQPVCLQAFFEWAATHTHPGTGAPTTAPPANGLSTNLGAS
jgi:phage gp45-like